MKETYKRNNYQTMENRGKSKKHKRVLQGQRSDKSSVFKVSFCLICKSFQFSIFHIIW